VPFTKAHRNANSKLNSPQHQIHAQNLSVDPRSGSRGSQRSVFHTSSTPNLITQSEAQMRPHYGRLETIESIASVQTYRSHAQHPDHSRSQSVVQGMPLVGELPLPGSLAGAGMLNHQFQTPDSSSMRTASPLGHFSAGKEKKTKKKRRRAERNASDMSTQDDFETAKNSAYRGSKEKKGSKCLVM
jgi:hypothetical protein